MICVVCRDIATVWCAEIFPQCDMQGYFHNNVICRDIARERQPKLDKGHHSIPTSHTLMQGLEFLNIWENISLMLNKSFQNFLKVIGLRLLVFGRNLMEFPFSCSNICSPHIGPSVKLARSQMWIWLLMNFPHWLQLRLLYPNGNVGNRNLEIQKYRNTKV